MIRNSYLWNNVVVGTGCIVKESILGTGVTLESGVVVEKGCLIAEGVTLRAHSRITEFSRVAVSTGDDIDGKKIEYPDLKRLTDSFLDNTLDGLPEQDQDSESDEMGDPFESTANLRYLRLGKPGY